MCGTKEIQKNKAKVMEIKEGTISDERRTGAPLQPDHLIHTEKRPLFSNRREVPAEKISVLPGRYREVREKTQKEWIREYEQGSKDYEAFGVGFSLDQALVTAADSEYMKRVKLSLRAYLEIREDLFKTHSIADLEMREILKREDEGEDSTHRNRGKMVDILHSEDDLRFEEFTENERERLGEAYDRLQKAIREYKDQNSMPFKFGRGAARLRQVRLIEERIHIDNNRFYLSSTKRALSDSSHLDYKYSKKEGVRMFLMPTWLKAVDIDAYISDRNQAYREERRRQKKEGTLPNVFVRMLQWSGRGLKNAMHRTEQAYHAVGGLVDRGLGLGTMIAANSLELAGKVVKAPIKLLSACFNGISKHIFGSKKRWKVEYSLKKGWKGLDEGRRIFRRYLKGACILPAAVIETLTRGVPALFGHHFKSGVYKRTVKWSKAIINDVVRVAGSIGIKDYGIADRADQEIRDIWRDMEAQENGEKIVDPESDDEEIEENGIGTEPVDKAHLQKDSSWLNQRKTRVRAAIEKLKKEKLPVTLQGVETKTRELFGEKDTALYESRDYLAEMQQELGNTASAEIAQMMEDFRQFKEQMGGMPSYPKGEVKFFYGKYLKAQYGTEKEMSEYEKHILLTHSLYLLALYKDQIFERMSRDKENQLADIHKLSALDREDSKKLQVIYKNHEEGRNLMYYLTRVSCHNDLNGAAVEMNNIDQLLKLLSLHYKQAKKDGQLLRFFKAIDGASFDNILDNMKQYNEAHPLPENIDNIDNIDNNINNIGLRH
jgi:hypothetical protein